MDTIALCAHVLCKSGESDDLYSDHAVPSQYDATKYKRFIFCRIHVGHDDKTSKNWFEFVNNRYF